MRFNLDICFTDDDRGISYQATAHGSAWHETPARGPSYSSGGGEWTGLEIRRCSGVLIVKVLIACEFSGVVREAFAKRGHNAWSCDLVPTEQPGKHIVGDVLDLIELGWDLMIAHPPCTYLCSSGLHWNKRIEGRAEKTEAALAFVRRLLDCSIARIVLENPKGCIGTRIRPAEQWIQPYEFGEDASKKTGLWLKGVSRLQPTKRIPGRMVMHKGKLVERWGNQTDSGQNKLRPSEQRSDDRARTYLGIAEAMADQWGGVVSNQQRQTA